MVESGPLPSSRERIIITLREPYNKNFYLHNIETWLAHAVDLHDYFVVKYQPNEYIFYGETQFGFVVSHESGRDIYPWAAVQEIDFFNIPQVDTP